jgi:hypothetical protein
MTMRVLRTEDRRDASRVGVLLDIIDLNDLPCRIDEGLTARSLCRGTGSRSAQLVDRSRQPRRRCMATAGGFAKRGVAA